MRKGIALWEPFASSECDERADLNQRRTCLPVLPDAGEQTDAKKAGYAFTIPL
jgi:hypothetical protein